MAVRCKAPNEKEFLDVGPAIITLDDIKESLKKRICCTTRKASNIMIQFLHYTSLSEPATKNASLYWLTRMIAGGEDPVYIARRLVRMASEDIGLADPKALG